MDRLLAMILNRLMGQLIRKGINHVATKGKPPAQMTPEDRQTAKLAREAGRRAAQAAKLARRLMR